jgi:hypothetical protein
VFDKISLIGILRASLEIRVRKHSILPSRDIALALPGPCSEFAYTAHGRPPSRFFNYFGTCKE